MKYWGNRFRPWARRLLSAATLLAPLFLFLSVTTCGDLHSLLLTIESSEKVDRLQYKITDLNTGAVIYKSPQQTITRDISKPGDGLRVAVEFVAPGRYLAQVVAKGSSHHFFAAGYQVDGVLEETASLQKVNPSLDEDQDGVPICGAKGIACAGGACTFLDCNDKDAKVNPFAKEVCGDGKDNDCSAGCGAKAGAGDEQCVDSDGDGDASDKDCDDKDPCRSSKLKEAAHTCANCPGGLAAGTFPVLPKACQEKLSKAGKTTKAPFCGDGIDQDCSGKDAACVVDQDCDCYPASDDCDDKNAKINKGMKEVCGDGIDNNCDGHKDEGCIRCDVDGDGYASPGTTDKLCDKMPKTDPDDFDSGINTGTTTADPNGSEGGTVLGALRQWCSFTKMTKNSTPAAPVAERDIDHDGDKLPAKTDGCPSKTCDDDGDGFQNKSCNPPLSKTDCNDKDPMVFPGSPDKCGDKVVQNCVADKACAAIIDADKDGYSSKDDCNDADPNVFPWAVEKCDGKDNDCDGLIDEGNPDHLGKELIPTNVKTCNDDNDGECAPDCTPGAKNCSPGGNLLSGICACSSQPPSGARDEQDRVKCTGENLKQSPSPRCFGALQKQAERCDTKDWDCNEKNDDLQGLNFKDKGKPCSVAKGTCKVGKVTGCDLSKSVANTAMVVAVMKKHGVEFNPNWVCSGDSLFPIPEVCNGRDDDCDGVSAIQDVVGVDVGSTEMDEKDVDGDKYMACKAPCNGVGRTSLAPGLKGCGDCDETTVFRATVYPGALEDCNNRDDNCKNGITDDGMNVCPAKGAGWVCCSAQKACRNINTDKINCGSCGKVCNTQVADSCKGGKCVCGTTGGACANGLNCVNGKCTCISGTGSRCAGGCCDGNVCRPFLPGGTQSASKCGFGGQACKSCDDSNECTKDTCTSKGTCHSTNLANNPVVKCNSNKGRCWAGKCCLGCIGSGGCEPGSTISNCGLGGVGCSTCQSGTQCKADSCSAGTCALVNKPGTTTCADGKYCTVGDKCNAGVCVGSTRDCSVMSDSCNTGDCSEAKKCYAVPKAALTPCASGKGKCYGGSCCSGCWDGTATTCRTGTTTSKCGADGGSCATCPTPSNVCLAADCSSAGVCGTTFKGAQAPCTSGGNSGLCYNTSPSPSCCTGCWDTTNTKCEAGTTTAACGDDGYACLTCTAPNECKTASCSSTTGKCVYTNKPDAVTACSSNTGKCYGGQCCTTCYNGTKCVAATGIMCGTGGGNCVNCSQVGPGTCASGVCTCTGCYAMSSGLKTCYPGTTNKLCLDGATAGSDCTDCTAETPATTCNSTTKVCE